MSARVTNHLAAAAWPSAVGETIEGRYLLEERVDVDGPCAVYRARDKADHLVAVQVLHDASSRAQFQRAAETLAALSHPNIAGIRETGLWGQGGYLVLEWLEGEKLASRLRSGPLTLEAGLSIARQLLAALASVHAAGLVHGALSPSHVFLQRRKHGERVKVQHFRLLPANRTARAAESRISLQAELADRYRAPELASGLLDARTDVFALGVMLSEIALAISGPSADAAARSSELPETARDEAEHAAAVSAVMQELSRRATAERPAERFSDAAELLCELIDALPRGAGAAGSLAPSSPSARVSVVAAPSPAAAAAARDAKLAASKLAQAPSPFAVAASARAELAAAASAPWKTRGARRLHGSAASASSVRANGASAAHANGSGAPSEPAAGVTTELGSVLSSGLTAASEAQLAAVSNASVAGANAFSAAAPSQSSVLATDVSSAYLAVAEDASDDEATTAFGLSLPNGFDHLAPAAGVDAFSSRTRGLRLRRPFSARALSAFSEFSASLHGVLPSQRVMRLFHTQLSAALVGALIAAGGLTWLMRSDAGAPASSSLPKSRSSLVHAPEPARLAATVGEPSRLAATVGEPARLAAAQSEPARLTPTLADEAANSEPASREAPETSFHAAIAAGSATPPARAAAVSPGHPPRAALGITSRNPWLDPVPAELQGLPAYVASGGKGTEAMVRTLHDYIGAQPRDPRPHLLLGGLYFNRLWRADCVAEWALALRRDPSVRAAPQLLPSLIHLVIQGKDAPAAADLIVDYYGNEALDAVEDAIPPLRNSQAAARLQSLHARLVSDN
jgi:hypothetical protein